MKKYNPISQCLVLPVASLLLCATAGAQQPSSIEAELLQNAQMWTERNRPDMARDQWEKLLSVNPNSPEGLMFSAELAMQNNKTAEARKVLETLQAKHPQHAATRSLEILIRVNTADKEKLAQMRLFARAGRKNEAAQAAQELFASGAPTLGSLALEYTRIMGSSSGASSTASPKVADERSQQQRKADERAAQIAKDPLIPARDAALKALDSGDLVLAESRLAALLLRQPNDAESLGGLGLVRLRQGKHDEAQQLFVRANKISPQAKWTQLQATAEFWGLVRKAEASAAQKDWSTATTYAQQAITLQPDNPQALLTLAEIKALSGDTEAAQRLYEKVLQKEPKNDSALKNLALLLSGQGQHARALELLEKAGSGSKALATELASTKADILQSQADAFIAANQTGPAIRVLEAALAISPDNAWLRFKTAKLYQRLAQFQEANTVMDDGIKLAPSDPDMRYARALVRSSLEDDAGVIEDIDAVRASGQTPKMQALRLQSKIRVTVNQAADSNKPAEQASLLASAEAMAGDDPDLLLSVADAWFSLGQPLKGAAVFDGLQARQKSLTPDMQLQYAALLNSAKLDAALAQKLPALLSNPNWDTKQESRLLDIYADHQGRQIEAEKLAGNHDNARRLANMPLPTRHAENAKVRDRASTRLLLAAQDHAQAALVIRSALVQTPNDAGLHADLARTLVKTGAFAEAAEEVNWLSAHTPKNNIGERLALVRLWQEAKAPDQARQEIDELVVQNPDNLDVLMSAAWFEQSEKRYKPALALFRRARDIELGGTPATLPAQTQATNTPALALTQQAVTTAEASPLASEIQRGIDLIETKQMRWVEVGQKRLQKSSTDGISTLNGWERTAKFSFPGNGDGRLFFQIDQVDLNAGALPAFNTGLENFGQLPTKPSAIYPADVLSQSARGANLGVGYERDGLRFDFGFIGVGLPVTNVVGGISQSFDAGPYSLSVELSRRPLTGSLLSYAGAIDPVSRQTWGGVVATGVGGRIATDVGDYSVSASANYAALTGENVESNTRLRVRLAVDRDVFKSANHTVNFGLNLSAWRYGKDLSEFTWGHGGYYSPRRYLSLSAPLEWTGYEGPLSWQLRGAVSFSRNSSNPSDYFPSSAALQGLAGGSVYAGGEGEGLGRSLRGALEYKIAPATTIGALLEIEKADYYAPTNLLLYARHYFGDVTVAPAKRPSPVGTYSSF